VLGVSLGSFRPQIARLAGKEFAVWSMQRLSVTSLAQNMSRGRQINAVHVGRTFDNTEHEGQSAGV
jgi:hypothetical protein